MRDHRFTATGVIRDPIVTEVAIFNIITRSNLMTKGNIGLMHALYTVVKAQLSYKLGVRHAHGVSFSVEYVGILVALLDLPWGILCMYKVRVFHDFGK